MLALSLSTGLEAPGRVLTGTLPSETPGLSPGAIWLLSAGLAAFVTWLGRPSRGGLLLRGWQIGTLEG